MASLSIPDTVAAQAADWTARLSAADPLERDNARAGFAAWQQQDPLHAAAAERMQEVMDRMASVRSASGGHPGPARAAFQAAFNPTKNPPTGRRSKRVAAVLALVLALVLPGWLVWQAYPPSYIAADLRTGTGQCQTRTLADGSRITLGSGSAVDLHFDPQRRSLVLLQGEILVEVAPDAQRPFVVETAQGRIRALGTRFSVESQPDSTLLTMLESSVWVQTAAQTGSEGTAIQAGQRVRIRADGLGPVEAVDVRSVQDAWKFHQLVARDQPLPEVLDALNRHRPGRIVYDRAQLQDIRMLAVLPLDDTDRALQLLTDSLPALRVRRLTPYLVLVDAPSQP
nr:FecR domain-containing protein [uncultured Albidiferax sp.]